MKHPTNLEETKIYVNNDLTPSRAKITCDLRSKDHVRGVVTANENITLFSKIIKKWYLVIYTSYRSRL